MSIRPSMYFLIFKKTDSGRDMRDNYFPWPYRSKYVFRVFYFQYLNSIVT